MAHYAYLDENNTVIQVTVGKDEGEGGIDWERYYGAKRTSFNTRGGIHLQGGQPFRKNYAGIGYIYDAERDAFIPPRPYQSWQLDETTCLWNPPVPRPEDNDKRWDWDEATLSWAESSGGI